MEGLSATKSSLPETIEDLARFALIGREKLAAVRAEIRAIDKLKLADDVRAQKKGEAQSIAEAVMDAEVRVGELLRTVPAQITGRPTEESTHSSAPTLTPKQQARENIGITRQQADRFVKLADNKEIVEQAKAEARENDDIVSRSFALEKIKAAERERKREAIPTAAPKPLEGEYSVIYADPPWQYDFAASENRAIENQYPTMCLEEIKAIPIPAANEAALFMWATAPKLQEAFELMDAWGFTYKTCAVWDKEKIGMGYWFRGQHELLLVGTKGAFSPPDAGRRVSSVYREARGAHSKKPDYYYGLLEAMFPGENLLELFARRRYSKKWEVWGNQAE